MNIFSRSTYESESYFDEFPNLWEKYKTYVKENFSDDNKPINNLAFDINFHDGRVVFMRKSGESLEAMYLVGDLSSGYKEVSVFYDLIPDYPLDKKNIESIINDRRSEIVVSEFYRNSRNRSFHGVLFEPAGEINIGFSRIGYKVAELDYRYIDYFGEPFIDDD